MNQNLEKIASACLKCKNTQCKKHCPIHTNIPNTNSLMLQLVKDG